MLSVLLVVCGFLVPQTASAAIPSFESSYLTSFVLSEVTEDWVHIDFTYDVEDTEGLFITYKPYNSATRKNAPLDGIFTWVKTGPLPSTIYYEIVDARGNVLEENSFYATAENVPSGNLIPPPPLEKFESRYLEHLSFGVARNGGYFVAVKSHSSVVPTDDLFFYYRFDEEEIHEAGLNLGTIYQYALGQAEDKELTFGIMDSNGRWLESVTYNLNASNVPSENLAVFVGETPPPIEDVRGLTASAKYDEVLLSWALPDHELYEKAIIYRLTMNAQPVASISDLFFKKAKAAEYAPLFETNGTSFKDLTVNPDTSYTYKVTAAYEDGTETEGVTTTVRTQARPETPPINGGEDGNGDYTLNWDARDGEMIIQVDGADYARVDAQEGGFTIPAADVPRNMLGQPTGIRIVYVSPEGDESTPVPPVGNENPIAGVELPFNATDVLFNSMSLIMLLGGFVLLGLIFGFYPRIIRRIKEAVVNNGKRSVAGRSRHRI